MSIYKRGNIWWCKFKIKGRLAAVRESCRTADESAARKFEKALKERYEENLEYVAGGRVGIVALATLDITRARISQQERGRVNEKIIKTLIIHWRHLRNFFEKNPEDTKDPLEITARDLAAYRQHRASQNITPQTWKRELRALRRGIKLAEVEYNFRSPLRDADWPTARNAERNLQKRGKYRSPEEVEAWLNLLDDEARDQAIFIAFTSIRKEETIRFRPQDVVYTGNPHAPAVVTLRHTKSGYERRVALLPQALAAVERQIARNCPKARALGTVFAKDHCQTMGTACKTLGIFPNITRRDLRATFLSRLLKTSTDIKATMEMGGHKTIQAAELYQFSTSQRELDAVMSYAKDFAAKGAHRQGTSNVSNSDEDDKAAI